MTNSSLSWLVAILIFAGCDTGDATREISEVREVARERPPYQRPPTTEERFGLRPRDTAHGHGGQGTPHGRAQQPRSRLAWDLPDGWERGPQRQMREASFDIRGKPDLDCYVAKARGGLVPNLNRWRRQMGLSPETAEAIEALPRTRLLGRDATVVDLDGEFAGMGAMESMKGYRMLGLILFVGEDGLFLKMTGPFAAVESEKKNFDRFAASLRVGAQDGSATTPPLQRGGSDGGDLSWRPPDGWEKQPDRQMRKVTYRPAGDPKAQCYVSVWPGNVGGLLLNINRWRGEAGAHPLTMAEIDLLPKTKALGRDVPLLHVEGDFRGMGGAPLSGAGLMAIFCELSGRTVTVKMTGPAALVSQEKDNFVAFCESLKADG